MTEPYTLDKGTARLVLNAPKWGSCLSVWNGAGATSIRLSAGEMLALAKALCDHARAAK